MAIVHCVYLRATRLLPIIIHICVLHCDCARVAVSISESGLQRRINTMSENSKRWCYIKRRKKTMTTGHKDNENSLCDCWLYINLRKKMVVTNEKRGTKTPQRFTRNTIILWSVSVERARGGILFPVVLSRAPRRSFSAASRLFSMSMSKLRCLPRIYLMMFTAFACVARLRACLCVWHTASRCCLTSLITAWTVCSKYDIPGGCRCVNKLPSII